VSHYTQDVEDLAITHRAKAALQSCVYVGPDYLRVATLYAAECSPIDHERPSPFTTG
jgi:hypothetical protein